MLSYKDKMKLRSRIFISNYYIVKLLSKKLLGTKFIHTNFCTQNIHKFNCDI